MSQIINIISAIGNNSSIYPLLVRDCGIEVPTKIGMTYTQNLKESKQMAHNAVRERFIDEYGTSAIWLGGIPLMDKIGDSIIKKCGYNPSINPKLYKETNTQGLKLNIEKFKNSAPKSIKDLEKVLKNKATYEKLLASKFLLSTTIPVALMGYFLPKANFALTNKIKEKQNLQKQKNNQDNVSFKGFASSVANLSTVNKMALTDGGLTVGRVGTARNKYEKMEMSFKMSSMMFLNFLAPIWIANGLDKLSNKLFKTNVNLDPKILSDKNLLEAIKTDKLELPQKDYIEFLDKNPKSIFSNLAQKYCGVSYLDNGIRDPRVYIDEKKLQEFSNEIKRFAESAKNSGDIDKFTNKALKVKSGNIIANVGISSFLLAVALPKLTFLLRKKVTGSDAEPGLVSNK